MTDRKTSSASWVLQQAAARRHDVDRARHLLAAWHARCPQPHLEPKHIVVADAILGSNANEIREFIDTYWPHLALVSLLTAAMIGLFLWVERRLKVDFPHSGRHF